MKREKFNILNIILDKTIFGFLIVLISLTLDFAFSQNSFAEYYKATLSASVNENTAVIDGTEAIESSSETAEHAINLKVKTTNKTGYTATISSKTEETALLNTNPAINTKINSISSTYSLANFPANTWGYRFDDDIDFSPIPAQSTPVNLIKTTEKSTAEENHNIKLGMKLNSSLKPGNYENKLIISVVSNPYTPKAIMIEGKDFNAKLKALETETNKIEHFKKSPVAPAASINAVNIDDDESECEIKLWLDPTDKTAYYYTEPGKVYLNKKSNEMFFSKSDEQKIKNILEIDLSNFDTSEVTNMGNMFYGMSNLTTLNVSHFNTSKVTDMGLMFHDVRNLTSLNLSNFDTSKVTNMGNMFSSMTNLTSLNLSSFNTSEVTNMDFMFYGIPNLTSLDLSNFDTSKTTKTSFMFYGMRNLTALNLSSFNTSQVTDMSGMFSSMPSLTSLNLSNFDTSNVTDMYNMFYGMSNVTALDLSNFDTSQVTNMENMFSLRDEDKLNDKLETIYVNNDFNTAKVINFSAMFVNRKKLRGGNGSFLAAPGAADLSWLRVDRPGVQGYFTRKP